MSIKRRNMLIIAILGVVLVIVVGIYIFNKMFYHNYYLDIVLVENASISNDWLEIESNNRIIWMKDRQFISLLLTPPFRLDPYAKAIVAPEGHKVNPEIILVDEDGNEYSLTYAKGRIRGVGEEISYEYKQDFPPNKSFSRVRIRSSLPVQTKAILWSGYDIKDMP